MIEVVKFKKEHMTELLKEPHNKLLAPLLTEEYCAAIEFAGNAITIFRKDDKHVLGCGGIALYWPGRGEGWAVFTEHCKREFVPIFRQVKRIVETFPCTRIEAAIDVNFKTGHRWIKLLGFKLDAERLEGYLPDGGAVSLYSRVK